MKTWRTGRKIGSKEFCVGESVFSVSIYPNGHRKKAKGHVSVFLSNKNDWDVKVDVTFTIGNQSKNDRFQISPNIGHGWPQFCEHEDILGEYDDYYEEWVGADDALDGDGNLNLSVDMSVIWEEVIKDRKDTKDLLEESKIEVENLKSEVTDLKTEIKTLISNAKGGRKEAKAEIASLKSEMQSLISDLIESLAKPGILKSTIPLPECPICFEEMAPPTRIIQCISGHFICNNCESKTEVTCCPMCKQKFTGRAFGMEDYLRTTNEEAGLSRALLEIPSRINYTVAPSCITFD